MVNRRKVPGKFYSRYEILRPYVLGTLELTLILAVNLVTLLVVLEVSKVPGFVLPVACIGLTSALIMCICLSLNAFSAAISSVKLLLRKRKPKCLRREPPGENRLFKTIPNTWDLGELLTILMSASCPLASVTTSLPEFLVHRQPSDIKTWTAKHRTPLLISYSAATILSAFLLGARASWLSHSIQLFFVWGILWLVLALPVGYFVYLTNHLVDRRFSWWQRITRLLKRYG